MLCKIKRTERCSLPVPGTTVNVRCCLCTHGRFVWAKASISRSALGLKNVSDANSIAGKWGHPQPNCLHNQAATCIQSYTLGESAYWVALAWESPFSYNTNPISMGSSLPRLAGKANLDGGEYDLGHSVASVCLCVYEHVPMFLSELQSSSSTRLRMRLE